MNMSSWGPPSSPIPKTFATTFCFKRLYLTIGSGSHLNTACVRHISEIRQNLADDEKLHEETAFAELNVFPVIPKIVQGAVFLEQPELVIVWAEDCLVMIPVVDVLRGGEVCSSGIISTQRHVLLVTRINGNSVRVFYLNGSIDDVRFERSKSLKGRYKYVRIRSRVATFKKGKFLALCNCFRDGESVGVKLMSTEDEILDMPTLENIAMPKIYTKEREFLYMECLHKQEGYIALLHDHIYVTNVVGTKRYEWIVPGRFTCLVQHDKFMIAGDKSGNLYVYKLEKETISELGKRWFPGTGGFRFITKIDNTCLVVIDGGGSVRWFDWTLLTLPRIGADSTTTIVTYQHGVRSASWGFNGLVVLLEGPIVHMKCLQIKKASAKPREEAKMLVVNERNPLTNRKLTMTSAASCSQDYRQIVTITYGDRHLFVRNDVDDRRKQSPTAWERYMVLSAPDSSMTDKPTRLSVIAVTFAFPKFLICQTTHSITVYDIERRTPDRINIHSYLEMKIPSDQSNGKNLKMKRKTTKTHVITSAAVILTSAEFCEMFGVTPTGRRLVVGTQTGLILWSHIPFEPSNRPFLLLRHSASAATGGRAVVRILAPNDLHIQAITKDARTITMFSVPTETVEGGISVTDVSRLGRRFGQVLDAVSFRGYTYFVTYRKNLLTLTSPSKSGALLEISVDSRRSYCNIMVDMDPKGQAKIAVYFIRNSESCRTILEIPLSMCIMDGYGSARITAAIALHPNAHTNHQSTLLVTGNDHGQISLYKMDNQREFCQLRVHLVKLSRKISAMASIFHQEQEETNFAVAVGGTRGQIVIFTINGLVPYVRHQTPERSTADVVALEFVQHLATRLSLVVILGNGAVETYQVITSLGAKLFDDQIPCYDVTLISMTSINPISQPIAAAYLLPAYSMRGGNVACFGCYKWPQMSHPMELVTLFRFDSGTVKRYELAECETQKESYNIYESKSTFQCSAVAMRFVVTPLSKRLFICVNGGNDGTLTMLAHCDDRVRHVFGHLDRCHDSEISSIQLSQWRTSQGFYLLVSSLDQSGLVIIRRMLVSNQKIFFDPQPIRKYVSIRRPSQLMMIPEKKHVIVTGEGIQVISYSAQC